MTGSGGATSASNAGGTIVPLYTDPGHSSWTAIVSAKLAHPTVDVVAIVNPNDGPGASKSASYTTGIATLTAAGIRVIGYVATGYAANSLSSVDAMMDQWKAFYPQIQGIFFDEQSNIASDVPHYRQLTTYAKSLGFKYTVGNPGADTDESFIGVFDTMLIYETDGLPTLSRLQGWHTKYPKSNFGIIPYATGMNAQLVRDARPFVQFIYLQNDSLPNPWDTLPPFFGELLAALE